MLWLSVACILLEICFLRIPKVEGFSLFPPQLNPSLKSCLRRDRATSTTSTTSTRLMQSNDDKEDDDEERRMEMVRQLQKTFYQSTATTSSDEDKDEGPYLEPETGRMMHLPLWRVGWIEVPGRANCLNVHEGHYTNMFEKILATPKEENGWYFGHLHLPGGTKASRSNEPQFALKTWQEECQDDTRFDIPERSAVVGTLMRIADYRRIQDGRLVILVHALERFVVDTVVQSFPHGVAHVQILPDTDLWMSDATSKMDENFAKVKRAKAVADAFSYYHDYECDPSIVLALPQDTEYMKAQDIFGVEIAKCLPFAFLAEQDTLLPEPEQQPEEAEEASFAGGTPLLEDLLQRDLILRNPPPVVGIKSLLLPDPTMNDDDEGNQSAPTTDDLERLVWQNLQDLCRAARYKLPLEIARLKPPGMEDVLPTEQPQTIEHSVSTKYPKARRQWRLSFHVASQLENISSEGVMELRHKMLMTPSTRYRLAALVERLQDINNTYMGQFE
ncbi:expressed unknown protein [Seminavis robusta]|uniref:Lon N-terminal domain-containing protein n=1 Tax=Seminavis robusta TaxID=568900 RepID=A0A9N8H5U1_9STRA|nr:expressed unknown protein [Seminavis robusta]|eukprot:Sro31_g020000.1 n/a (502) ;mRNA; f:5311-6816